MATKEIIAPCTLCRTVTEVRAYGPNDSLICLSCAKETNPAAVQAVIDRAHETAIKHAAMLQALAGCFGEFIDPRNPTSTSVH